MGRGRAFLNVGTAHADKGMLDQALQDFATANALGDLGGNALFNMGAVLSQQKKFSEALNAFWAAQSKGFNGQALHYQKPRRFWPWANLAKHSRNTPKPFRRLRKILPAPSRWSKPFASSVRKQPSGLSNIR